jgi:hypothetical protein
MRWAQMRGALCGALTNCHFRTVRCSQGDGEPVVSGSPTESACLGWGLKVSLSVLVVLVFCYDCREESLV